jgi:putative ABC transport system permease protein
MTPIALSPLDIALSAVLILLDAGLSLALGLRLERQVGIAALRMVVQLLLVGVVLRLVFAWANPAVTLLVVVLMLLAAAREVAVRPESRLVRGGNLVIGGVAVGAATALTAILALTTAIRPHPWFDPHYAIPLAGIIMGNALNGASLTLDAMLGGVGRERPAIEARLCLGDNFAAAMLPLVRNSIRRGLLPTINTMSASGIVTLPGIMTGQILAGMDPLEAVKYQILLMFLLAGGSGVATVSTALLVQARLTDGRQRLRLDRLRPAS